MSAQIIQGNNLETIKGVEDRSVQCCVTSPPYFGLRDYSTGKWIGGTDSSCTHRPDATQNQRGINSSTLGGGKNHTGHKQEGYKSVCPKCGAIRVDEQIGLEETPEEYVAKLVLLFREVRRTLRDDGTLWLNLGDSYAGSGKGGQSEEKRSNNWQPNYGNKSKTYGLKPKDLIGIPWRVALALQSDGADFRAVKTLERVMDELLQEYDGELPEKVMNVYERLQREYSDAKGTSWYLRSDIIWHKPNAMPESAKDRPTSSHEYIFLMSKSRKYFYDAEAVLEPYTKPLDRWGGNNLKAEGESSWDKGTGQSSYRDRNMRPNPKGRNRRSVWTVNTKPYKDAHFAVFPPALIEPCVLAGSRPGDTILDPFNGSGTTGEVAIRNNRNYVGLELNAEYVKLTQKRLAQVTPTFRLEANPT